MIRDHTGEFPTAANAAQVQRDAAREACRPGLAESLPQATLDALSAHIAVLDAEGGIIAVNRAWRAFAEANPPVASNVNEGASYLAVCDAAKGADADVAAAVAAGIRAVIRGDESTVEMEYPCHSPEVNRWFVCRVSRFPGTGIARVVVAHENITARKQMELDLQASEMRYRRLFESAKDGILILDAETGMVVDVNPFLIQLLGISREAFLGKEIWELGFFRDVVANQESFAELQQSEYIRYEDKPLQTADGRQIDVEFVSNVYLVNRQKVIQCNIRDITARKHAEAEYEQLQAQLLQAQKLESIGTLAGGVAHEINNPVMGIMNYAQLIVDELGPGSPVTEYATEIGKETQRVATIVKNLLSFARVDKDTYKSPAGIGDIIEDTLSLIRAVIRHDQIMLEVNVPADLPSILCRSQQIRQVLMNLLTNARDTLNQKYPGHDANKMIIISARNVERGTRNTESGTQDESLASSATPHSSIPQSAIRDPRSWVRITVEDRGAGIPQDLRERIFDPFFSTKERHKGTGLGLSISHGIIKDHGGALSVESEAGQWTRFNVDLPVI